MPNPPLYPFNLTVARIRVTQDDPNDEPGTIPADPRPRPHGSRRPHTDAKVARVRRLIEETELTYSEIGKRTGVGRASICRWTRDQKWRRPPFAPRATDTIPRPRAGQKLKLRLLAERLRMLAERHVEELEASANVDVEALMQALELLKMARLEAQGRRRRRRQWDEPRTGAWARSREEAVRSALKELHRGGVNLDRAPKAAVDLVLEAKMPAEEHPALRGRGRKGR